MSPLESASPPTELFPSSFPAYFVTLSNAGKTDSPTKLFTLLSRSSAPTDKVLLLVHGYPQNHVLWYDIVARLPAAVLEEFTIIIPDLPGYGLSTKSVSSDGTHEAHSKKAVAADLIELVDKIMGSCTSKLVVVGHDRGARVGYRMAKDFRSRVVGVCLQDIVPTKYVFDSMKLFPSRHYETFKSYHWIFLALDSPLPETLIGQNPAFYITHTIDSWTGSRHKNGLNPIAMNSWVGQYDSPDVILGALEDYRAGSGVDIDHDLEDEQRDGGDRAKVHCSLLVLFSVHLRKRFDVAKVWEGLAGAELRCVHVGDEGTGHFLPVEAAEETAREMVDWIATLKF